ncbi:hypothetical protein Q8W71_24745 [Methylobacterium sp. NEAU 140]|uniref:hypothetical protein n=1 Tax=Methylobacterium sp. NEAU 140 TaxID=3064945 RepID=UPI002734212D|nr:hypothetical protein [Methylobacterium sp. NEAU 140]MDP4025844.1 hypothetical protein [Methylobacterium sp. NEAU 140]
MEQRSSARGSGPFRDRLDAALAQGAYRLIRRTVGLTRYAWVIRLVRFLAGLSAADLSEPLLRRIAEAYETEHGIAQSAAAQRDLLKVSRIFPGSKTLFARLLRLGVNADLDPEIEPFIRRIAIEAVLRDPEIALLLLFQRIKHEHFAGAADDLRAIPFTAIDRDPLLIDVWRIASIHLIVRSETEYFATFQPAAFVRIIELERNPVILRELLMKLLYKPIAPHLIAETIERLATRVFDGAPENFAVVSFFLMTCGYLSEAAQLESVNTEFTQGRLHPLYLRAKLFPLALGDAPRPVARADLERASQDPDPWYWPNADLLRAEIGARLATSSAPEPTAPGVGAGRTHLLVAFFGQMRFPARTLPGIKAWIDANVSGPERGVDVSYGVATWRETGSKVITPEDSFDYLLPYFPPGCEGALRRLGLARVADAPRVFPRFAERVLESLAGTSDVVSEAEIEGLLKTDVHFAIGRDAQFMADTGSLIADFAPGDRHMLNQGRMLDRIGAVGDLVEHLDHAGRPVTHLLFIRPDLHQLAGSLAACLDRMKPERNWAVLDQDHLAELMEGVGDRYILADRTAAAHVIGMRDKVRRLFRAVPRDPLACSRLTPHQMLASVLFEAAVDVRTVSRSEIRWDFLRATVTWQDFLPALRADVEGMEEGPVKRDLLAAVSA